MNKRMDTSKLNIGAYILQPYARSEKHIKEVAESGLDFILNIEASDRDALDLFHKYGLGAIVTGAVPVWWGGNGHVGEMDKVCPVEIYEKGAANFVDHPAAWGIDIGDEPSALDFEHLGKVMDCVNNRFTNQFANLNLYPSYARVAENTEDEIKSDLGTKTYQEYIDRYCAYIPSDHISYDFYPFTHDIKLKKTDSCPRIGQRYENMRIVEDACRKSGRKHWFVMQVNALDPELVPADDYYIPGLNHLRFQAFTAMAFGVECIIWACYTAGWWGYNILDTQGNKTEQYDKMQQVNKEIHTIGEEYMKYRNVATHFVGFEGHSDLDGVNQEAISSLDTGVFFDVKADNGNPILVGQMVSRADDDTYALMICAADDSHNLGNESYNITFRTGSRVVQAIGGEGKLPVTKMEDGTYSVPICSNEGILLTVK